MRKVSLSIVLLAAVAFVPGCATVAPGSSDFHVSDNTLMRGTSSVTMRGIQVPDLVAGGPELENIVAPMARVAGAGANTVVIGLPEGSVTPGGELDPGVLETITAIGERAGGQRMYVALRVIPQGADAAARSAAVEAVARTFRDEPRVVYWIDGPDAPELAARFKRIAPNVVVAAPANGDLETRPLAGGPLHPLDVVVGDIPEAHLDDVHFILHGSDADYARLDEALTSEAELLDWTPDDSLLSEEERAEGFYSLFNGQDIDNWWVFGWNKDAFAVSEDGVIETVESGGSALMTPKRYDNFVLRLDYRIEEDGNSGIFIRSPRAARQSRIGMEMQIRGDYGAEPTDDNTGAIYWVVAPSVNASRPAGEWNEVEIRADGPHIKITINGEQVQDVNLDEHEELRYRLREGFIGLQDHTSYVGFRNIRIKEL